jgi:hypothetical protein
MFQKLSFELDEFVATRSSDRNMAARSYRALNLAWTAWHLHDWFFEGRMAAGDHGLSVVRPALPEMHLAKPGKKQAQLSLFGNALAERFEALRICRTLATAGKHAKAERLSMPELRTYEVRPIPWMPESPHGPVCWDVRILAGNKPWDALDLFRQAQADWKEFFTQIGVTVPIRAPMAEPRPPWSAGGDSICHRRAPD